MLSGSSEPTGRLRSLVIDCSDLERSAAFWSAVLGLGVHHRHEEYLWFDELHPGFRLVLQEVSDTKVQKTRIHFDLEPTDFASLVDRIEDLGGTRVEYVDTAEYSLMVMADPDGNEFCVNETLSSVTAGMHAPDGEGR